MIFHTVKYPVHDHRDSDILIKKEMQISNISKRLRIKITSNLLVLFALGCAGVGVYFFVTPVPTREEAFQKLRSQVFDHWEAERSSLPTMSWHCNYTSIFPIEISKNTTIKNATLIGNNTSLVESVEYGWPELLYNQKNSDAPKLSPLKLSSNFTLPKNWDNSTGNRANMTCDYKGASGLHGRYTAEIPYILTKSVGFVELNCRLGPCERSSDTVCQNQPLCTDVCKAGEWNFGQESCVMTYHLHAVCLRAVKMNDVYDIDEDAHPCFNIAPDWFALNATTTGHPIVQYYANSEAWYRRNASGDFVFEVRENSDPIFWIAENTQSTFTFDRTIAEKRLPAFVLFGCGGIFLILSVVSFFILYHTPPDTTPTSKAQGAAPVQIQASAPSGAPSQTTKLPESHSRAPLAPVKSTSATVLLREQSMTPGTIPTMLQNSSTTFNGNVQQYGTNGQYYTMQHNQANQGMPIGTPNNGYLMTQGYGQTNMNMYAGTNQQQYYANDGSQMTDQFQNQAQTQKIWAPDQTYVQMFQRAQQVANPNAQAYPYANTGGFQSSQYPYGNTNY